MDKRIARISCSIVVLPPHPLEEKGIKASMITSPPKGILTIDERDNLSCPPSDFPQSLSSIRENRTRRGRDARKTLTCFRNS